MGMTGQGIYDNFHQNAAGTESWQAAQQAAIQMSQELPGQATRIKRLQDGMEAAWTGDAADAAQQGVTPLALEHLHVADDLHAAQDLMSRQAASFHQAANAVRPMPPEPTVQDPLAAVVAGQPLDTMLTQVTQYNVVAQHNVDVMTTYDGASRYNATNMPTAYGALADHPMTIAIQPAPGGTASTAPSGSTVSPRRTPTPSRTTPTAGRPGTPAVGRPPAPSGGVGAAAPGDASSTTTSAAGGTTGRGPAGAVSTEQSGAVAGNGNSGLVTGQPAATGPDGGSPVDAGPGVRGGPGEPGVGGQRRFGAGQTGGAGGEPVGGSPARGGQSRGLSGGAAGDEEALAARSGEPEAGAPGFSDVPAGGGRRAEEDDEHHRKYPFVMDAEAVFADGLPKVAPEAFGESPRERAARHAREAEYGH